MNQPIVRMSINFKSGGTRVQPDAPLLERHGDLDMARLHDFHQIIGLAPQRPHAIFVQEAKWWDRHAAELLHYVERQLRTTGYGIIDRCLARGALTTVPGSVWVDESDLRYSDHRAISGALTVTDDPAGVAS